MAAVPKASAMLHGSGPTPLEGAPSMHRSPPPRSLVGPDTTRSRVLIIAEGAALREDLGRLLGAHVVAAVDERSAAIKAARSSPPDLVLAALGPLPEGLALIRDLREAPATAAAPIIALSASADGGMLVEGLRAGADDWIALPFRPEELCARVEARLRTARFHRDAEQALLAWNNRYEATIRATGHLLYDWDPGTNRVVYGGDTEGVVGYALEEMGDGLAEWIAIIHPDDRAAFLAEIDRVMRTKSPFEMSYRVTQKSGRVIHCEDRGYFFSDAGGDIARMVGFVADVTARKRLQQERDALLFAEQKARAEAERPPGRAGSQAFGCPASLAGLRILVVDDEEDARSLLVSILEQCEAEVEAVPSAAEAMEKLRDRRPDVLLSDIAMPDEDGLALMRRIRALAPDQGGRIAAVAITALARVEDRTRALKAGFNLHLPKPVDPAELLAAIANVTGRLPAV